MRTSLLFPTLIFAFMLPTIAQSQIDEAELGAWYMYFFNTSFKESPWGMQGDIQYRNWDSGGDLEQLLLRGGLTYSPKEADIKFTLGYGNITTGAYGSSNSTSAESRIYQEALFPVQFGKRIYTNHRFRFEQRLAEDQDLRTRYRYNLFLNIPINRASMEESTFYLALYNELFINGQRNIGDGRSVELFDRNRFYTALGYIIKKDLKVQLGVMRQNTDSWGKDQLQVSLHQSF